MSANISKNLLKNNKSNFEKNRKKTYHRDIFMFIQTAFPAIAYGIIFVLQSIIDESINFSFLLAAFSFCVTLSFEINEWIIYFSKAKNKKYKVFNYFPPLLFLFILLMIIAFTYNGINALIDIPSNILSKIANLSSSLILLGYFISYTCRNILIRHNAYLQKEDFKQ